MPSTNISDTFTYNVSLARVGDTFTLPSGGTVSSTSLPAVDPIALYKARKSIADTVTDSIWTLLANLTAFKWDKSGDEKENYVSDGNGGSVLDDSFSIKVKREATATLNQSSPIFEEIHLCSGALDDASTTVAIDSVPTKYFWMHVEKFSRRLQQVVQSYEMYVQATADSLDDGNYEDFPTFEVKFKRLSNSNERYANIPAGSSVVAGPGQILKLADGAIVAHTLVTVSSATQVSEAAISDVPIGVAPSAADSGDQVAVSLLNGGLTAIVMYASEAITAGTTVYAAASGFVSLLSATPGTYNAVGVALSTTTDAGNISVAPLSPYPVVVS
jgi:hypothetical protein